MRVCDVHVYAVGRNVAAYGYRERTKCDVGVYSANSPLLAHRFFLVLKSACDQASCFPSCCSSHFYRLLTHACTVLCGKWLCTSNKKITIYGLVCANNRGTPRRSGLIGKDLVYYCSLHGCSLHRYQTNACAKSFHVSGYLAALNSLLWHFRRKVHGLRSLI